MSAREILCSARREAGLTQADLADLLGENVHWVSNRETGTSRITLNDARRIADALKLDPEGWLALRGAA